MKRAPIVRKIIFILFIAGCITNTSTTFSQVNVQDSLALVDLYNSTDGSNWTHTWDLSNPVNTWYGVTIQNNRVFLLALDYNNLSGTLPSSLGNLNAAAGISFQINNLSGNIPKEFKNLSNLALLHLVENKLSGKVDSGLLQLPNLGVLSLGDNNLSGQIPNVFTGKSKISLLDFSFNNFSGKIPASFDSLSHLQTLAINNNKLSGTIPSLVDLSSLNYLYLDYNGFTFKGMENLVQKFSSIHTFNYAPQNIIQLHYNAGIFSVSAGGTLSNDTYHWYKDGNLYLEKTGDSTLSITEPGNYSVAVTNAVATDLTLYSDTLNITALPVTLISFTAQKQNNAALLQWQTTNEINNNYFDVERSSNSKVFSTIVTKQGLNNAGTNNYSFTDNTPLKGINYYRLKQVDKDGEYAYSGIVSVEFLNDGSAFAISPNPANNFINVISSENLNDVQIRISDINGKILYQAKRNFVASQPIKISVSGFPANLLIVTIKSGNAVNEFKIIGE